MAVVQQTSARWQIVQVPGEAERKLTTVNVYAAMIEPKMANSIIRELNSKAPLPLLGHVKRVKRSVTEGTLELSIILCMADGVEFGKESNLPALISEVMEKYSLQPFMAAVVEQPATTREEWEMQCTIWPTSFHPNSGKSAANVELSQADADTMCYFMELAIKQARLAGQRGQLANGAIIVDPALGAVVGMGHDETAPWCTCVCGGSNKPLGHQTVEKLKTTLSDGWHPLQHAVMKAIQMVAERDKRLWPADDTKATEGGRGEDDCSLLVEVGYTTISEDKLLHPQDQDEATGVTSTIQITRPYLCTILTYMSRGNHVQCVQWLWYTRDYEGLSMESQIP